MTAPWWRPDVFAKKRAYLEARAQIFSRAREFFSTRGYLEVETPALQVSPCMEAHLQAFKTQWQGREFYLHTSPEFAMKKLLVAGLPKIFQFAKVFRDEVKSRWHSPEFCMLEWYQVGMDYKDMMDETLDLIRHASSNVMTANGVTCDPAAPAQKITVVDALREYADVNILPHLNDVAHIKAEARRIGVHVSDSDDWDNALLKILMDRVEPEMGKGAPSVLYDYPVSMAALARPKPEDPRFAERFEIYVCGIELANAFGELTDPNIQRDRFLHDVALRKATYGQDYPVDHDFLAALEHGLPAASGNALGMDRLVMLATGAANIDLVQAQPII